MRKSLLLGLIASATVWIMISGAITANALQSATTANVEMAALPPSSEGDNIVSENTHPLTELQTSVTPMSGTLQHFAYLPIVMRRYRSAPAIYWGAIISGRAYGLKDDPPWSMQAVDIFESHVGKKISILHWGRRWWANNAYYGFDPTLMETVRQRGYYSLLDWTSWAYGQVAHEDAPFFKLSRIIDGTHDTYIREWATAAKNWGHPFFLRFDYEMNGDWFPWSEVTNSNSSGQYVQAWRHVHDIFTQVGANNVTWVWCPNIDLADSIPLENLYPGDTYVDWTCIDGYNWGPEPNHGGRWWVFYDIFKPTYDHILAIAPNKPMMIGETSSTELNGSKAAWITDALNVQMPQSFPKMKAFVWFNVNADNMDWPVESSASAQAAFKEGITSSYYGFNEAFGMEQSPIPPLYP